MEFLTGLLAAGGISAMIVGVLYLLYKEMIKKNIFEKMKSWQTFVFFCLLAILIFGALVFIFERTRETRADNPDAKPFSEHFQADARYGLFCEQENVFSEFVTFYDFAQIQADGCADASKVGSIGFSVRRSSGEVFASSFQERSGYRNCHRTDFPESARTLFENANEAFGAMKTNATGCEIFVTGVTRVLNVRYTDIYGDAREAYFGLTYYGPDEDFVVQDIASNAVARPSDWAVLAVSEGNTVSVEEAERVTTFFQ